MDQHTTRVEEKVCGIVDFKRRKSLYCDIDDIDGAGQCSSNDDYVHPDEQEASIMEVKMDKSTKYQVGAISLEREKLNPFIGSLKAESESIYCF